MNAFAITVDHDGEQVAIEYDDVSAEAVTVVLRTADRVALPRTIVVEGESLTRVDGDPTAGEWTVEDDGSVVARP